MMRRWSSYCSRRRVVSPINLSLTAALSVSVLALLLAGVDEVISQAVAGGGDDESSPSSSLVVDDVNKSLFSQRIGIDETAAGNDPVDEGDTADEVHQVNVHDFGGDEDDEAGDGKENEDASDEENPIVAADSEIVKKETADNNAGGAAGDDQPPNFWSFLESVVPDGVMPGPDVPRNPLARTGISVGVVPHISSADGHEDWRKNPPKKASGNKNFADDSALMHFLDDDDDDGEESVKSAAEPDKTVESARTAAVAGDGNGDGDDGSELKWMGVAENDDNDDGTSIEDMLADEDADENAEDVGVGNISKNDEVMASDNGQMMAIQMVSIEENIYRDGDEHADDDGEMDQRLTCFDADSIEFVAATNPRTYYASDSRRKFRKGPARLDFLVYAVGGRAARQLDFNRDVAVHWVYTSPEGQQCEIPEPGREKEEFLLTSAASCDFGRDFQMSKMPVPDKNALCTTLQLSQEDVLNFLPGTFNVKLYFRCRHDHIHSEDSYIHSWTSAEQIAIDYRRPLDSWFNRYASPEVAIAGCVLLLGLVSGLLAVCLWRRLLPPGSDGFQYSRLRSPVHQQGCQQQGCPTFRDDQGISSQRQQKGAPLASGKKPAHPTWV